MKWYALFSMFLAITVLACIGCQVRPQFDTYTGQSQVSAANQAEVSINDLVANNDALRDKIQAAAVAIYQQKAAATQPVTAADVAKVQTKLGALQAAAATQPVPLDQWISVYQDMLILQGRLMQQTPVTAADLEALRIGQATDRTERAEVARGANNGRVATGIVRQLGMRSMAIGQAEQQNLGMFGVK